MKPATSLLYVIALNVDSMLSPVDQWLRHLIEWLAQVLVSKLFFLFDKQSTPFLKWALASHHAWPSPAGMPEHSSYHMQQFLK